MADILTADALITGFPGFIAGRLVRELLARQSDNRFVFLVLPKMCALAARRLAEIERELPAFEGRWEIVEGDITAQQLGLDDETHARLTAQVGVVWHLAAIYDLSVEEQIAYRVNVTGTIHVLDFCEACQDFARLNYISTCYVSGDRVGRIYEDELDTRQHHKNHYEETKFWAEVEVQRRAEHVPTAILRPGIVVGDSRTGETDKYDGPYYIFKLLERLPGWVPLPNIGGGQAVVNLVPVDFVAAAMAHIGLAEGAEGQVYQLADPNPMRASDVLALTLEALGRPPARGNVPSKLVDDLMRSERLEHTLNVPREAVVYFNHDARYDTTNTTRALAGTGIHCPHLSGYLTTLIDYMLQFPDKSFLDDREI